MSAPLSFDRVLAALRRLFPIDVTITRPAGALPAAGDSAIGKELGTAAWMTARANDRVEAMPNELFPDTAVESLSRWEKVVRTATNAALSNATRQGKILSILRRSGGVQLDRLGKTLYAVLGLTSQSQIQFLETLRSQIETALTVDSGIVVLNLPCQVELGRPLPGVIDDMGVRVYIEFDGYNPAAPSVVTVTSPKGTVWTFNQTAAIAWYENRTAFTGELPREGWKISATMVGSSTQIFRYKLLVSNDLDSAQIYSFYAWRDPGLPGTPDLPEAQRLFERTALAHMSAYVIQSKAAVVDDPNSLVDRDPVGA